MRIECDKCGAKYSIADEKVRGKTFKIRCKKCSNVIIVRDKAAAAGGGAAADAGASEPAAEEPPGWHLAIDGETVGPLAEDEVRRRYDAGEIDKATSVWQEGFEDWLELGQIEAFADLPDRDPAAAAAMGGGAAAAAMGGAAAASAPADDPFAAAGDGGFAGSSGEFGGGGDAGFGGGFGSEPEAPAAAAAAPAAAEESPRIDSLTGQRNENSVLFSLDSLKAMATTQKPASAGPVRSAPSTTAPASEGSGLIDIRAMSAMMDAQDGGDVGGGGGGGGGEDEMLPSFGGGGLGGLSVEPLATEPPPSAVPAQPEKERSNAPMYILIALLAIGLIGLGAMLFFQEDEQPQVIKEVVTVPGSVEEKDKDEDEDEDKDEDEDEDKDAEGDTEGAADTEGATEDTKAGGPTRKRKKKSGGGGGGGGGSGGVAGSGGGGGGDSGGGSGGGSTKKEPDVDCLLDPNLPKCKGGGGGGGGGGNDAPDPSLPKKLGQTQILSGISAAKSAAKSCGSGATVAVKFSVKGSTGKVISAKAQGEHAGTSIGKCVEGAAKKASFPKFQASQQGFTFKFRL